MRRSFRLAVAVAILSALGLARNGAAQEPRKTAERAAVPITFLPPPMENATFSLGIYDGKSGALVRRLHEVASESAFTAGLNGLITGWDGKDDAGKPVPPGRYEARGYAVGPLKVEGVAFHGNDWVSADESLRLTHIEAIALVPEDDGLVALATLADGSTDLFRLSGEEGTLLWRKRVAAGSPGPSPSLTFDFGDNLYVMPGAAPGDPARRQASIAGYSLKDGSETGGRVVEEERRASLAPLPPGATLVTPPVAAPSSEIRAPVLSLASPPSREAPPLSRQWPALPRPSGGGSSWLGQGKDGTTWEAAHALGLLQRAKDHTVLRRLEVAPGDPEPVAVSASTKEDVLYLLEEKDGWQRVRGLSWMDAKEEDGHAVSTWKTFFERSIRAPEASSGVGDPATARGASPPVEIALAENPLLPGKPAKVKLGCVFDGQGSYLATADGLRLRKISERPDLRAARLVKGSAPGKLTFFQSDGAAWDEFSIEGADRIMAVDGGDFELTESGEKPAPAKAAEPPDL